MIVPDSIEEAPIWRLQLCLKPEIYFRKLIGIEMRLSNYTPERTDRWIKTDKWSKTALFLTHPQ